MKFRVLVTGAGGIGGVNFVRALRYGARFSNDEMFILGTEFNSYYASLPILDVTVKTPRHSDPSFVTTLKDLCARHKVGFLHPNPSSEEKVVAEHLDDFENIGVRTYLPRVEDISPDKERIWRVMRKSGVSVPGAFFPKESEDIRAGFDKLRAPLWIRAKEGAGARLSLKVGSVEEAEAWVNLHVTQGRASRVSDFFLQDFLGGRDIAFDSLWYRGRLLSYSARERLEYPLKHISLTGLTGTPSVARILHDDRITKLGVASVKALDPRPHGFYSTDIKEDGARGDPYVTEVDAKWHTTASLWGYALAKAKRDNSYNVAFSYLLVGTGKKEPEEARVPGDLYPEGYTLVRQMDSGVLLIDEDGKRKWRILPS